MRSTYLCIDIIYRIFVSATYVEENEQKRTYFLLGAGEEYNFCNQSTQDKHIDK